MLHPGVTQEWVDEGELSRERTKNRRWRRPYDVLAEATRGEVVVQFITRESVCNGDVTRRRHGVFVCASKLALDESLSHQHMGAVYHRGRSPRELLGGHSGVEAGDRKGRGSDDESNGAQLPKSKVLVRKEVDSEEHHSTAEADLPIAKEGVQM
ncbi:hypothetical protein GW17_00059216 [Ensete ventricosum]|nr:hypothetical protein GW17_00059216 [Ensete ventricosum]